MPKTDWGWQVTPDELESWIVFHDNTILALNKPAHLVCHPSKKGPWSSLIGAAREYLGSDRLHLVSRLDRETSGIVVVAKQPGVARLLNIALQERSVRKTYLAIMQGQLHEPVVVDQPVGRDTASSFFTRQWIVPQGQPSVTEFIPLHHNGAYTLARVHPVTGRRHQIRVHAAFIGHSLVGDKLYGPDPTFMHRFIQEGFTPDMAESLKLDRQALHALSIEFPDAAFTAPLAEELSTFWQEAGGCSLAVNVHR